MSSVMRRGMAGYLGSFGGIFGEVAGNHGIGDRVPATHGDDAHVYLLAPFDEPSAGAGGVRRGNERDGARRVMDGVIQVSDSDSGRWRDDGFQVAGVDAVQAQQDVEMDGSAGLEFGGLAMGNPDRWHPTRAPVPAGNQHERQAATAGQVGELTFDVLLGTPPQLPGGMIPDGMGVVVVAVRAQRLAYSRVAALMASEAGEGLAVLAGAAVAASVAGIGPTGAPGPVGAGVAADRPGVHWTERGGR